VLMFRPWVGDSHFRRFDQGGRVIPLSRPCRRSSLPTLRYTF